MENNFIDQVRAFNRFYTEIIGVTNSRILESPYSLSEVRVLFEIYHHPHITARQIKDNMGLDEGYLSRLITKFVKQELVIKENLKTDHRIFTLCLTEKGRHIFLKLDKAAAEATLESFKHLSTKEMEELLYHFESIKALIDKKNTKPITLDEIKIRTSIHPGDLGFIMHRHGKLYEREYQYGVSFETYVGAGIHEFYSNFNPELDQAWICEHLGSIVGFILLMHRKNNAAQLRYFYLEPAYRGIGLGKKLMALFIGFLKEKKYQSAYLWTTDELHTAASLYQRHGFKLTETKDSNAFGKPLKEQRYDLFEV